MIAKYSESRVLPEKLTGPQLVKTFPAFYGTRRFITAFTRARHLSVFYHSTQNYLGGSSCRSNETQNTAKTGHPGQLPVVILIAVHVLGAGTVLDSALLPETPDVLLERPVRGFAPILLLVAGHGVVYCFNRFAKSGVGMQR